MNKKLKLTCLSFILMLAFSCGENKSKVKEADTSEFAVSIKTDTLKFTSGIRAIFQDSKGNYWFGSLQEGVAVYNGNSFTYFTTNEGLSDNQIQRIREDEEGLIWFNTQSGISSYDGESIKNHISTINDVSTSFNSLSFYDTTQNKWMKTDTELWFGAGIKEGVYRYDGVKLIYLAFPPHQVLNHYDNLFAVTSISKGSNNMIWFGTYAGVFGYNGREFTIINDETLDFDRAIAPLHIRSILEDSKGRLWIGNNGIGVLLKEGDSIFNFSEEKNLIHPSNSRKGDKSPPGTLEHVFRITEDSQGNIWFGDRDTGVWKYDGVNIKNYTEKDGITDYSALSIYVDKNGELWFGMGDGDVYKFNGEIFEKQF